MYSWHEWSGERGCFELTDPQTLPGRRHVGGVRVPYWLVIHGAFCNPLYHRLQACPLGLIPGLTCFECSPDSLAFRSRKQWIRSHCADCPGWICTAPNRFSRRGTLISTLSRPDIYFNPQFWVELLEATEFEVIDNTRRFQSRWIMDCQPASKHRSFIQATLAWTSISARAAV